MFKKAPTSHVLNVREVENKLMVELSKPEGFDFQAGQYGTFKISGLKLDSSRTFSFASSPDEPTLKLGTQMSDPPSKYKDALKELKKNDEIIVKGPFGDFTWKNIHPKKVFIGLGVGITPIRSLLMSRDDLSEVTLIYAGASHKLYLDEFKALKAAGLSLIETQHRDDLNQALTTLPDSTQTEFYISGSMKAVNGVAKTVKQLGANKKTIYSDIFTGY